MRKWLASGKDGARGAPALPSGAQPRPKTDAAAKAERNHLRSLIGYCVLVCLSGSLAGYFFGPWLAAGWVAAVIGAHIYIHRIAGNAAGPKATPRNVFLANLTLQLLWSLSSIALFATLNGAAWVFAMAATTTLAFHTVFSGARSERQQFVFLAIAALPMFVFMTIAAWMAFPWWIAIPASLSGIGTLAAIGSAASLANRNHRRMRTASNTARAIQRKLEFAVESIGDGYFEIDLGSMVFAPNPALARGLGYAPANLKAAGLRRCIHPDDAGHFFSQLEKCKAGDTMGWDQDFRVREASGGFRWMALRARVLDAVGDGPQLLIGALVDLTVRKQFEQELHAAKEAADASNLAKSQFLATMSHEIRTPLNGVLGMAQALDSDPLAPEQKEKVAVILESGQTLTILLNDVLDLSKIEAGKLEIAPVRGDLLQIVKRASQLFAPIAKEKGIALGLRIDGQLPPSLVFDPVRVRQCVANLVSNAVKFTAAGGVDIVVAMERASDGAGLVSIRIIDTGIGMSNETLAKLFGLFTQADSSTTRRFGGSGLGLAISRQLARLMGGDLVVTSEEGQGSTFHLSFRVNVAEALPAPATLVPASPGATRRSLLGARLLLTDDNAINRQVIKLLLAPHGLAITEAVNGAEALEKLSTAPFDIVLLDVHMPVMDGKEAIQRIRASSEPWRSIPVIALTADAMHGDRDRFVALGMTDYLAKPVDKRDLVEKLETLLGFGSTDEAAAAAG